MATEILAVGIAAASSPEQTLAAGVTTVLTLKNSVGGVIGSDCAADIEYKGSDNLWYKFAVLAAQPQVITGPMVYRASRRAGGSCGVDKG